MISKLLSLINLECHQFKDYNTIIIKYVGSSIDPSKGVGVGCGWSGF
jgi:hypothetical protein